MSLVLLFGGDAAPIPVDPGPWTMTDDVLITASGMSAPSSRDDIVNTYRVSAHPKVVDAAPTTIVYNQTNAILIPAGTTKLLLGSFTDPLTGDRMGATNIQLPPVADLDYVANDSETGEGTTRTSSLAITVTIGQGGARFQIFNSSSTDVWLTLLQLRGQGIYDRQEMTAEARNATSIAQYGERAVNLDMHYQHQLRIAQGAADYLLANESSNVPRVHTVRVIGKNATTISQILARDISDLVTVRETVTGIDAKFFINAIELIVLPSGHLTATYTLVRLQQGQYWLLGTSVLGVNTIPAPF
jgi:hypothetical protein